MKKIIALFAFASFFGSLAGNANAALLKGSINDLPESIENFTWGNGVNDLFQQWSTNTIKPEGTGKNYGWFYPSNYPWSNADVYVYSDLTDVSTVTNALFPYETQKAIRAGEGDTVFFRGINGYYGAWRIDDIYVNPNDEYPYTFLTGEWYFQDNGTGDFIDVISTPNPAPVPEPSTVLALVSIALMVLKKQTKKQS